MQRLIQFFGDLSIAWNAPKDALMEAGLSEKIASKVVAYRKVVDPEQLLADIYEKGIKVLISDDSAYPRKLKEIDQSPPVLYLLGEFTTPDEWAVAIVGTRRMTGYGKQVTNALANFLASRGITIVSGMARGIDAIAHQVALQAGGRTIAVLGSGVDVVYPPENRHLYEEIIQHGVVLSDYAPGTVPDGINFPPRNRIISGLSSATIVVEAGRKSGALITSTFAAEQGREVFAVPGNIFAPQSQGTNYLIQQGARPLVDFDEILEVLQFQNVQQQQAARQLLPVSEVEEQLLDVMGDHPIHVDEIHFKTGISMDVVTSTLTMMELKGIIYHAGNMNYAVIRDGQQKYGG